MTEPTHAHPSSAIPAQAVKPFKSRRVAFAIFLVIYLIWVGFLVWVYVRQISVNH